MCVATPTRIGEVSSLTAAPKWEAETYELFRWTEIC
jgi:hypothetical protein